VGFAVLVDVALGDELHVFEVGVVFGCFQFLFELGDFRFEGVEVVVVDVRDVAVQDGKDLGVLVGGSHINSMI
jgi:hypothetical protein